MRIDLLTCVCVVWITTHGQAADPVATAIPPAPPTPQAQWIAPAPLSPQDSLKTIQVPDGFAVELVAAEPMVLDPVAFAWGPDGRLWVVEMADYNWLPINDPSPKKPKGRVIYLTDTDGDGKYDQRTVFLDDLNYPTGVLPWRNGVLVTAAPDIIYAQDTTAKYGDDLPEKKAGQDEKENAGKPRGLTITSKTNGKADKIEKLYTGFVEGNPQLRVNGLQWGLDNWIYCANGLSNGVVRSHKTGQSVDIRGRDIRIRPDTGEIEPASGPSQFGRVRDDFGNWFGVDNSRLIIHYVLEDHYLRRNPHVAAPEPFIDLVTPRNPPCYPRGKKVERLHAPYMANRFTSACGIAVYRDNLLGDDVYGQVFVCEPVHNLITRRKLTEDGVTFKAERLPGEEQSEFLTSTDEWFRPVHLRTGPDGALWIADMYRAVVEHPQWLPEGFNKKVDWMQGSDRGRIWRVYRKEKPPLLPAPLHRENTKELIAELGSRNGTVRDLAHMQLIWSNSKDVPAKIREELAAIQSPPGARALHSLAILLAFADLNEKDIEQHFAWGDPQLAKGLLRFFSGNKDGKPPNVIGSDWLYDNDHYRGRPAIALQMVLALGSYKHEQVGKMLGLVATCNPSDPYVLAGVLSSGSGYEGVLVESCCPSEAGHAFYEALVTSAIGGNNAWNIAQVMASIKERSDRGGKLPAFRMVSAMLLALEKKGATLEQLHSAMDAAGKQHVDGLRGLFLEASIAVEKKGPLRFVAVNLIGRGFDDPKAGSKLLLSQLALTDTAEWHLAVLNALTRMPNAWSPQSLPDEVWRGSSPKVRAALVEMLLRREAWTPALLDAIEQKKLAANSLSTAQRQALTQHKTLAIRERAAKLLEQTNSDRVKVVAAHADVAAMKGDVTRGREHFERTCAVCHKLAGVGKGHGPDLSSLTDRSPGTLLQAILDPNQAVDARYVNYVAETSQGDTYAGMLLAESGASLTLVGPDGTKHVILRKDLASLRSTNLSLMPEGLETTLGKQGLADVIAFVIARSQPPRQLVGVKPAVIKPGADGAFVLPATACEAFGTSIVYEKEDNNLGQWTSPDDYAAWQIDVPTAAGTSAKPQAGGTDAKPQAGGTDAKPQAAGGEIRKYEVWFDYACDDQWKGNAIVFSAENDSGDSSTFTAKLPTTGTLDDYQQTTVGVIELTAGRQRLTLRSAGAITGRLMDLRGIRLSPVK